MMDSTSEGPLPPPQILEGYEQVSPGSAKRIIELTEIQGAHRRLMEERALEAQLEGMRRQFQEARLGQVLAVVVAILFLGAGTYIAIQGHPWPGTLLGIVGLCGAFTAFLGGSDRDESPTPQEPIKKRAPKRKPKVGREK
jgi:uncharacterized membrane protein